MKELIEKLDKIAYNYYLDVIKDVVYNNYDKDIKSFIPIDIDLKISAIVEKSKQVNQELAAVLDTDIFSVPYTPVRRQAIEDKYKIKLVSTFKNKFPHTTASFKKYITKELSTIDDEKLLYSHLNKFINNFIEEMYNYANIPHDKRRVKYSPPTE